VAEIIILRSLQMPGKKTKRQVRRTSTTTQSTSSSVVSGNGARASDREFNPDYGYVISDLRRIGILAGSFFILLIVLAVLMPYILR
jgi:hypothetical protein